MDVYHAHKVICVMVEQIRTNPYQLEITRAKFVQKDFIVLRDPQILLPVHLALSMQTMVWAHYNNAHCVKLVLTIMNMALKDATLVANLQLVMKAQQNVLVKVKIVSTHQMMALVDARLVSTSKQPKV
jgi:hypothetical protein